MVNVWFWHPSSAFAIIDAVSEYVPESFAGIVTVVLSDWVSPDALVREAVVTLPAVHAPLL
jgi:hypothetical protein